MTDSGNSDFQTIYNLAIAMAKAVSADGLLLLAESPMDWAKLKEQADDHPIVIVGETEEQVDGAKAAGFPAVRLPKADAPVHERLTQAVLESVADDLLKPQSRVVALYSGFEADKIDSISVINLREHLQKLRGADLRKLEDRVPLNTLKMVVDLAVDIGREGREGKPIGTLFVIGDVRKVMAASRPLVFDPVKGYSKKERNLHDRRVREALKEIAQMDGAFIVSSDGTIEASCRYLDAPAANLTLPKGLGARHWAAGSITRATKALGVSVSQSGGTVRIFKDGRVVLRIEPFRGPMKWTEFESEPPSTGD